MKYIDIRPTAEEYWNFADSHKNPKYIALMTRYIRSMKDCDRLEFKPRHLKHNYLLFDHFELGRSGVTANLSHYLDGVAIISPILFSNDTIKILNEKKYDEYIMYTFMRVIENAETVVHLRTRGSVRSVYSNRLFPSFDNQTDLELKFDLMGLPA